MSKARVSNASLSGYIAFLSLFQKPIPAELKGLTGIKKPVVHKPMTIYKAGDPTRTDGRLITNQLLYQLSYTSKGI